MKLLIVDDEPIILNSLKDMLLHTDYAGFTILTADNAMDAYELLQEEQPQIMLCDIQMPCLSGIDLLKKIYEDEVIDTNVIFITGYPDFHYAQSAIRYKAFDYLLKPVTKETLLPCLDKAVSSWELHERTRKLSATLTQFYKENRSLLKKQFLENLLINPLSSFSTDFFRQSVSLGLKFERFCMIGIRCDMRSENLLQNQEYYIAYSLSLFINQDYRELTSCYIGNIVYVLYPLSSADSPQQIQDCLDKFTASISAYARDRLLSCLTISISRTADSVQQIPSLNKQILQCFSFDRAYFSTENDNVIFFDDIDDYNTNILEINECISLLINAIRARDAQIARQMADRFLQLIEQETLSTQKDALQLVELNLHCQLEKSLTDPGDIGYLIHPISSRCRKEPCSENSRMIFHNCVNNIIQELAGVSDRHNNQLINSIIDYVNKNYERPIGLSDVAEYLGRNASYISRLLNKELHMGFAQLVTKHRLAAAKDLLANTSYKVADIAEKVGYTSPKYFHQVFVSNLNMTPSDYRAIMKQF